MVLTSLAVGIPVILVVAIAVSRLGAHHRSPGAGTAGTGQLKPTLDPAAQRIATAQLAGRVGAVVAIDPHTGAIRVMYGNARRNESDPATADGASPSLGPTAREAYSPGSAFEIVTAAAGLDTGLYRPNSLISGRSPLPASGTPIRNQFDQSLGQITLTQALTQSVDTVFARVGRTVGRRLMTTYMRRFGFYASPQLNAGALPASGVRLGGGLVLPSNRRVDLGRLAIGQENLAVTPLQMAMVAAAIADGGTLMAPQLQRTAPTVVDRVLQPSTARALTLMMRRVVVQGTGTPADLRGLQIAGKTGTAGSTARGSHHADLWFIGFAPADHPTVAIAVALKNVKGAYGGTIAAPIAAKVIEALLAERR